MTDNPMINVKTTRDLKSLLLPRLTSQPNLGEEISTLLNFDVKWSRITFVQAIQVYLAWRSIEYGDHQAAYLLDQLSIYFNSTNPTDTTNEERIP